MNFFSVEFFIFDIGGWKPSLMEILGVVSGLLTVYLTSRERLSSWPWGMANGFFFAVVLFQVQLYWDTALNVFYLVASAAGWWLWLHPAKQDPTQDSRGRGRLGISRVTTTQRWIILAVIFVTTLLGGLVGSQFHLWMPGIFPQPAALPYPDSFTTAASLGAFFLQLRKKWESWVIWILVDVVTVAVFYTRGIYLMAWVYGVFALVAVKGLLHWHKAWKNPQ